MRIILYCESIETDEFHWSDALTWERVSGRKCPTEMKLPMNSKAGPIHRTYILWSYLQIL